MKCSSTPQAALLATDFSLSRRNPIGCSQALTTCMDPILEKPNARDLADLTALDMAGGQVANTSNLANDNVFIFSGSLDSVVKSEVVQVTAEYYDLFIDSKRGGSVITEFNIKGEHCYPTNGTYGEACTQLGSPYIGKCNYDGAGISLRTLLGPERMGGLVHPP